MKRYYKVKNKVLLDLDGYCMAKRRQDAYEHLITVASYSILLAPKYGCKQEIAATIAILHDIGKYTKYATKDHAKISSEEALNYLGDFTKKEQKTIMTAIANHSDKDKVQGKYSELIKDCDSLAHYFAEMDAIYSKAKMKRINHVLKKINKA